MTNDCDQQRNASDDLADDRFARSARSNHPRCRPKRSYDLMALFLFLALFAVLFAIATSGYESASHVGVPSPWIPAISIGMIGMVPGIGVGLLHYRRVWGLLVGGPIGTVVGACLGPAVVTRDYDLMFTVTEVASLLFVFLCLVSVARRVRSCSSPPAP